MTKDRVFGKINLFQRKPSTSTPTFIVKAIIDTLQI